MNRNSGSDVENLDWKSESQDVRTSGLDHEVHFDQMQEIDDLQMEIPHEESCNENSDLPSCKEYTDPDLNCDSSQHQDETEQEFDNGKVTENDENYLLVNESTPLIDEPEANNLSILKKMEDDSQDTSDLGSLGRENNANYCAVNEKEDSIRDNFTKQISLHEDPEKKLVTNISDDYTRCNGNASTEDLESSASTDRLYLGSKGVYYSRVRDEDDGIAGEDDTDSEDEESNVATLDSTENLDETAIIEPEAISFFKLFRFADCTDRILMFIGFLGAVGMGSAIPINFLIYGRVLDLLIGTAVVQQSNTTVPEKIPTNSTEIFIEIQNNVKWFCIIGACVIVCAFLEMALWMWTSERQTRRMRLELFWSILNKHQGWFDQQHIGELTNHLNDDILAIQIGMGDKFAKTLEWTVTFLGGYIMGFVYGWKLTLVILSVFPILGFFVAVQTKLTRKLTMIETRSYASAASVAEEVLSAIRTVIAFGGEKKETERYSKYLDAARRAGVKKGTWSGAVQAAIWLIVFCSFGLAFWYGSKLVAEGEYTGGQVLQIFFGLLIGTTSFGHAVPYIETLTIARTAAAKVFDIIDQKSDIDGSSLEGQKPNKSEGHVEFKDVVFSYPTRKSVKVLDGLSFNIKVGTVLGVVGSSGSGKSTIIQLLQRFYDPHDGQILVDGIDIRELNVQWLRQQVGVVSQEPVLFATTIADNIKLGRLDVTQSQIEDAAKGANAHDFISTLPKGYETLIGEHGSQLSGGQKQRLAIARALVRNPKILLLDEATSALDMQSESIVQTALAKASKGRTTIVVAHRLSTIKNADMIICMQDGHIVEEGTHRQLLDNRGFYHSLVHTQNTFTREMSMDSIDFSDFSMSDEFVSEKRSLIQRQKTLNRMESVTIGFQRIGSGWNSCRRQVTVYRSQSVVSQAEQEALDSKLPAPSIGRVLKMNVAATPKIIMGCFGAVLMGAATPVFSILISEVLGNFASGDKEKLMSDAMFLAAMFVVLGVLSAFGVFTNHYFFTVSGEDLTMKIRQQVFAAMLKQPMGWFDKPFHNVGSLTARLSTDASRIRGAAGQQFGIVIQALANMGAAIIIAFIYGPKLAGAIFVFIPLMFASGAVQGKMVQDSTKGSILDLEKSSQVASEAIDNIRTVAALTREQHFQNEYKRHINEMYRKYSKNAFIFGLFYAVSQSIIFFAYAATFSYGGVLIEKGEMEFYNVFRVFAALIFGSMMLGRVLSWMPDYAQAKISAAKILEILDQKPNIKSAGIEEVSPETCEGHITMDSIIFSYPSRPNFTVLRGLSLSVSPGQTVALVGTSGCGKSTTIQILERFYDPCAGSLCLDGRQLSSLSLPWLRSQMGLVSQEPILFDLSIRDNIAYGNLSEDVTMSEIIEAARQANIHNFIESLPQGYDTNVGEKGTQLSGGQKQRIAIARALIRKPKILLLDEATSALDNESEKVVQEALDKARKGRTCIVIAHRLTTIREADVIMILKNGFVIEQGSHRELMNRRGFYYELHHAQRRARKTQIKRSKSRSNQLE